MDVDDGGRARGARNDAYPATSSWASQSMADVIGRGEVARVRRGSKSGNEEDLRDGQCRPRHGKARAPKTKTFVPRLIMKHGP